MKCFPLSSLLKSAVNNLRAKNLARFRLQNGYNKFLIKTILSVLPVPNSADFCNSSTLVVTPIFFQYPFKPFGMVSSAPIATGITWVLYPLVPCMYRASDVISFQVSDACYIHGS